MKNESDFNGQPRGSEDGDFDDEQEEVQDAAGNGSEHVDSTDQNEPESAKMHEVVRKLSSIGSTSRSTPKN